MWWFSPVIFVMFLFHEYLLPLCCVWTGRVPAFLKKGRQISLEDSVFTAFADKGIKNIKFATDQMNDS
jgi:hypothetical protein